MSDKFTTLPAPQRCEIIRAYARATGMPTFIETGTSDGSTTWNLRDDFGALHTIELDPHLHEQAVKRFADLPKVTCWLGDSAKVLPDVLEVVDGPAVVWLDGHNCSGKSWADGLDTPVVAELGVLFADGHRHVILIDDSRLFGGGPEHGLEGYTGYPDLAWVEALAVGYGYRFEVDFDVIRLTP